MSTAIPYSTNIFLPIFFNPFDLITSQNANVNGLKESFAFTASACMRVIVSSIVAITKSKRICLMSYVEKNQATAAVKNKYALLHFRKVKIAVPTSARF